MRNLSLLRSHHVNRDDQQYGNEQQLFRVTIDHSSHFSSTHFHHPLRNTLLTDDEKNISGLAHCPEMINSFTSSDTSRSSNEKFSITFSVSLELLV